MPADGDQNCKVIVGADGVTVKVSASTGCYAPVVACVTISVNALLSSGDMTVVYWTRFQIEAKTGGVSYYTSQVTYPSESYYEHMMSASVGHVGVMFIPPPVTKDNDDDDIVYCNIKGRNDTESDIIVGIRPGGANKPGFLLVAAVASIIVQHQIKAKFTCGD